MSTVSTKTILIVDDDEPTRHLLDVLMRRSALSSVVAPNGRKAIELLQSRDFACVILDLMMPAMDGTSVIRHLAESSSQIPVIVCTAMPPSTIPALDPTIVRAVVRKPFDVEEMAATVTALVK